jgi:hypothetical protein
MRSSTMILAIAGSVAAAPLSIPSLPLPGLPTNGTGAALPATPSLPSGSNLLGGLVGGLPALPGLGKRSAKAQNLPVVGDLLGGSSSGAKIPLVSSLLEGNGLDLPVLGRVPIVQKRSASAEAGLGAIQERQADLPVVGSLLGGISPSGAKIPVVSSLLEGEGLDLPVLGRVPIVQKARKQRRSASAAAGLGAIQKRVDLPVVGDLLGGGSSSGAKIPLVSSLLEGNGLDLPVLGRVPIVQKEKN